MRMWLTLGALGVVALVAGACPVISEECQSPTVISAVISAAPGLVDFTGGEARICLFACRGDSAAKRACDPALPDASPPGDCATIVSFPTYLNELWADTDCPPPPPIPPGYVLAFHDIDEDGAVSPGEPYGLVAHDGAPSLESLYLDVTIDRIAP